ncbi:hypothetical protein N9B31_06280 [Mariniblastus sp.]|nr:hypothetical protein [Mariniblastus sp.]MDA7909173.1 hypothetical protein [bacterium]MDA7905811.1 hypothetical protein [Mariniblastus sp.]MDA7924554.1 hypothetical protein [Mariniblastus sp.]MDA7928792.1 hypothetical protein [Mariniblastus sp.]
MNRKQAQRQKNILAAEGYLELATALEGSCSLDLDLKKQLVDLALCCLNKVIRPSGHKPYVLFLKGQAHRIAQRPRLAITFFEQSHRIDGENLHTCLALAWCCKRTQQIDRAVEVMQTAVELNSESSISHYNLACYCALNQRIDDALMHLTFALNLNPDYLASIASESDFDSIRDNPRFADVTTLAV